MCVCACAFWVVEKIFLCVSLLLSKHVKELDRNRSDSLRTRWKTERGEAERQDGVLPLVASCSPALRLYVLALCSRDSVAVHRWLWQMCGSLLCEYIDGCMCKLLHPACPVLINQEVTRGKLKSLHEGLSGLYSPGSAFPSSTRRPRWRQHETRLWRTQAAAGQHHWKPNIGPNIMQMLQIKLWN